MKKLKITSEGAYVLGMLLLAFGTSLITVADFGVSMVVAPAYLISEKVSFLTLGMAEYTLQAVIIFIMCLILRRFRWKYLFSFVTAVIYGCILDLDLWLVSLLGEPGFVLRCVMYLVGIVISSAGVAFFFNTYLPSEAYELFVKEIAEKYSFDLGKFKICYDCSSLAVACVMSVVFFGPWPLRGVGVGTVICAIVNGVIISAFSNFMKKRCDFTPLFDPPALLK